MVGEAAEYELRGYWTRFANAPIPKLVNEGCLFDRLIFSRQRDCYCYM